MKITHLSRIIMKQGCGCMRNPTFPRMISNTIFPYIKIHCRNLGFPCSFMHINCNLRSYIILQDLPPLSYFSNSYCNSITEVTGLLSHLQLFSPYFSCCSIRNQMQILVEMPIYRKYEGKKM